MNLELIIGNKAYSTWSLRPWLVLKRAGAEFNETIVQLNRFDTAEQIARYSPAGQVPVLLVDGQAMWDSLAICEWANETYPEAQLWPNDPVARRQARAVVAEFHAGFRAIRVECGMGPDHPMTGELLLPRHIPSKALSEELQRLVQMWSEARSRFDSDGEFLFGNWSIADAFFTPVAARIRHFGLDLSAYGDSGTAQAYVETLLSQKLLAEWLADA